MDNQVSLILNLLDQSFDHKAWHGTNLKGALRGMTAANAAWRPGVGRRNCWEIAVHCAYWKYAVWRRLVGAKRGSFSMKGSNWFAKPGTDVGLHAAWKADFALLVNMHRQLREVIAKTAVTKGNIALLTGIAAHDLYHAGQIQLLKRLRRTHA